MRFNVALLILGLTSFAAALPMESNPSPEPHSPAAAHVTGGVSGTNRGGTSGPPVLIYTFVNKGKANPALVRADAPEVVEGFLNIFGIQGNRAGKSESYDDGKTVIDVDFADPEHVEKILFYGTVKKTKKGISGMLLDAKTDQPTHVVENGKVLPSGSVIDPDEFGPNLRKDAGFWRNCCIAS
ncbi:hypothetical protein GGU10DRAFT_135661 [Lentinula aff. detonsa]|uniref:Uncharacterized protein n=1 Tax=Lentinula aff. detonsa TaxID=2804958 RepID=A0AA38NJG1_9AGAR|nr:hypothetical protein GGU10DRAFT_135661 [Lentinula aff. detonsa]